MTGVTLNAYLEQLDLIGAIPHDTKGRIFPFDKISYFYHTVVIIRWYVRVSNHDEGKVNVEMKPTNTSSKRRSSGHGHCLISARRSAWNI
jgi:hypothetical protein